MMQLIYQAHLSCVTRKPTGEFVKTGSAKKPCSGSALFFYLDSTMPLHSKSEVSSIKPSSVAV